MTIVTANGPLPIIEFNKIIEFIDFIGGNDIEYDSNFFKEKISGFEFKELK